MIRSGRGYTIIVLFAAVAVAAWLVQAQLRSDDNTPTAKPAAATVTDSPSPTSAEPAYGTGNDQAGGYGDYGAGADSSAAPVAAAGIKVVGLTGKTLARMGNAVVDDKGWILYRFDKDTADPSTSNCTGPCAERWPPVLVDAGGPQLTNIDSAKVATIVRADGGRQVTLGGWPLYRYSGDSAPGKWAGQGVGGTWFVAAGDGRKNLSCLPTATASP